jgi:hypothetical protein
MRWTYQCPHCKTLLNPQDAIILLAHRDEQRLLVGLHPEPGNYRIFFPPGAELRDGQTWDFACPACRAELRDPHNDTMCTIDLEEELEIKHVCFSRIAGQQATYVVQDRAVKEVYGRDAGKVVPKT